MEATILLVLEVVLLVVAAAAIALVLSGGLGSFFLANTGGWRWILTNMNTSTLLP